MAMAASPVDSLINEALMALFCYGGVELNGAAGGELPLPAGPATHHSSHRRHGRPRLCYFAFNTSARMPAAGAFPWQPISSSSAR
jgi:hypothetical protein